MKTETHDFKNIVVPEHLKFMVGSEGSADYLILGHKDHFNVGLRPLFDAGGPLVGFRIRIMWGDEEVTPMNIPETLKMTFPEVPFTRLTAKHGSVTGGIFLKGLDTSTIPVSAWLEQTDFVNNVLTSVEDMTGITMTFREDTYKVLAAAYLNMIDPTGKPETKGVESKPVADVLAFPTKNAPMGESDEQANGDDTGAV